MARHDQSRLYLVVIFLLLFYIFYTHFSEPRIPAARGLGSYKNEDGTGRVAASRQSGARIAMVTMNTKETSYDILSLSNKFSYANRHGYDLKVDFEGFNGEGMLHKMTMVEEAIKLERYDWVWWMDFDTLITNTTIKVEDIIAESLQDHPDPDSIRMLLTPDCFTLNAGSMLFRATPDVITFLNMVRECDHADDSKSEQDCIRDLVGVNDNAENHPVVSEEWAARALFIPQRKINAFPEEIRCWDKEKKPWQRGDFVIHFAGAWAHLQVEDPTGYLMEKYRHQIVNQ